MSDKFSLSDNSIEVTIGAEQFFVFPSRALISSAEEFRKLVAAAQKDNSIKNMLHEADCAAKLITAAVGEENARRIFELGTPNEDVFNVIGAAEHIYTKFREFIEGLQPIAKADKSANIPYIKTIK